MHAEDKTDNDRRRFLSSVGKFAVVTPPAVTLLLAAEGRNYAYAGSGRRGNGGGYKGGGNNGNHYGWYKNGKNGNRGNNGNSGKNR